MSFRPNPKQVRSDDVTDATLGTVVFAEGLDNKTTTLKHIGAEGNKLNTSDMDATELLAQVLIQLKIMNTHLSTITEDEITEEDMEI